MPPTTPFAEPLGATNKAKMSGQTVIDLVWKMLRSGRPVKLCFSARRLTDFGAIPVKC